MWPLAPATQVLLGQCAPFQEARRMPIECIDRTLEMTCDALTNVESR